MRQGWLLFSLDRWGNRYKDAKVLVLKVTDALVLKPAGRQPWSPHSMLGASTLLGRGHEPPTGRTNCWGTTGEGFHCMWDRRAPALTAYCRFPLPNSVDLQILSSGKWIFTEFGAWLKKAPAKRPLIIHITRAYRKNFKKITKLFVSSPTVNLQNKNNVTSMRT